MLPKFDLNKIRYSVDIGTYHRAIDLYKNQKVSQFSEKLSSFSAVVSGTSDYQVSVSANHFDVGRCDCYLGQNDVLCKHMIAVAIQAILKGKPFPDKFTKIITSPVCSAKIGSLSTSQSKKLKTEISQAFRYIKPYNGPSRIWFQYQDSLIEGSRRISEIISHQPVCLDVAKIIVSLMIRLDNKLMIGGVDDSDGTVGGLITDLCEVVKEFARIDPVCQKAFKKLDGIETGFGWEKSLQKQ